jgi:hypothetical protein
MSAQSHRDEEIICHSPGVAGEVVVLQPHTRVDVPIVPRYVGRSTETGRELRVADARANGPRTPLVWQPVAVAVVVAVVAPPASTIVVVARTVVAVVIDALGPSSGLDGVPHVAVWPEVASDC